MCENADTIEDFYGVYLLYCKNPQYLGRTYIGYTVDPNRRIKQHNKGKKHGGAWKTSDKGPWSMALIVHGFPNDIAALRFEWAWQHPTFSRRLNHVPKQKYREKQYDYRIRLLSEMLCLGPWVRLPLTVRWLDENLMRDFTSLKLPPIHMPICQGSVVSRKIGLKPSEESSEDPERVPKIDLCSICDQKIDGNRLRCLTKTCNLISHAVCLSKSFLELGEYVPIQGHCPVCKTNYLWNDIVRKLKGCYGNLD